MVTDNFKKIICGIILNSGNTSEGNSTAYPKASQTLKRIDGSTKNTVSGSSFGAYPMQSAINAFNQFKSNISNGIQGISVRVGTGDTEPTAKDYNLEEQAEGVAITAVATTPTQSGTKIYTVTFANTTQEDINLKEVGLFLSFFPDNSSPEVYMLDRTAVDITLLAGDTKTYNYEISFN
jgi:hypothetical protein